MSSAVRKKQKKAQYFRKKNREIWEAGDADRWLAFAKLVDPRQKNLRTKGPSIVTNCVNGHADNDPSMYITPSKGLVHCFSCGYHEWDAVRFWSKFSGKTSIDTIKEMQQFLGVKVLTPTETKEMEKEAKYQRYRNWLAYDCFRVHLISAIAEWYKCGKDDSKFALSEYSYSIETLKYLENRQILDSCHLLQIGLFPKRSQLKTLVEKHFQPTEALEVLEYLAKYYAYETYIGSMVFFYHSTSNTVCRFRLRLPKADGAKNIISIDDQFEDKLGFFGLGTYGRELSRVLVVEGEFDQMLYSAQAQACGNTELAVIAHGGGSSIDLSGLEQFGVDEIGYIPDTDEGGNNNAKKILQANPQFKIKVFIWPQEILDPKKEKTDIDDAVKLYGFKPVHDALMDWDRNWIKPEFWSKLRVEETIKKNNIEDADEICHLVTSYASCIGSKSDTSQVITINKWIRDTLQDLGVDESLAKNISNDFTAKDSEEIVFINRLRQKICDRLEFLFIDRNKAAAPITTWDRKSKELLIFRAGSDSNVKSSMANVFGKLVDWIKDEISIPNFIRFGMVALNADEDSELTERPVVMQEDDIVSYATMAFKDITSGLPSESDFKIVTAGVHELPTELGPMIFIVNGNTVYKMWFDNDGTKNVEELRSPVYERYFFRPGKQKAWSTHITLENLRKPQSTNLLYRMTHFAEIISEGWSFQNQETEPWSLASLGVGATTLCIFPQNLQFLASNERSTGKSTLYADLFGGKNSDIQLVEHTKFFDGATPAGIRQSMNGSSLIMILDEFDNQEGGVRTAEKMDSVMKILRITSNGEGVDVQGTPEGDSRIYYLNFSSMIAGIDPNITEANMTRFFPTDLKSGLDGRKPPRSAIFSKWSQEEMAAFRAQLTLDGFDDIPKLKQAYSTVKRECEKDPSVLGAVNLRRFKENVMILAAYWCAAGLDWKDIARKTCEFKRDKVEVISSQTSNESLISAVLHSPVIAQVEGSLRKLKVSDFFSKQYLASECDALNSSGSGAYIFKDSMSDKWYLLVNWQESISSTGILRGNPYLKIHDKPAKLMSVADRYQYTLKKYKVQELYERMPELPAWTLDVPVTMIDITPKISAELKRNQNAMEVARRRAEKEGKYVSPPVTHLQQ